MKHIPADLAAEMIAASELGVSVVDVRRQATVTPAVDAVSEKDFQAAVVALAKRHGWKCYHPYNSRKSDEGYPDLTLARDRIVWMELKTETGVVSAAQASWNEILLAAGEEAYIFRPSNWPEIVAILTAEPRQKDWKCAQQVLK